MSEHTPTTDTETRLSLLLWQLTDGKLSKPTCPVSFMVQEVEERLGQQLEAEVRAETAEQIAQALEDHWDAVRDIVDTPNGFRLAVETFIDIARDHGGER